MRQETYPGSELVIEETLGAGVNYDRYVASYESENLTIYGLLTVPRGEQPDPLPPVAGTTRSPRRPPCLPAVPGVRCSTWTSRSRASGPGSAVGVQSGVTQPFGPMDHYMWCHDRKLPQEMVATMGFLHPSCSSRPIPCERTTSARPRSRGGSGAGRGPAGRRAGAWSPSRFGSTRCDDRQFEAAQNSVPTSRTTRGLISAPSG